MHGSSQVDNQVTTAREALGCGPLCVELLLSNLGLFASRRGRGEDDIPSPGIDLVGLALPARPTPLGRLRSLGLLAGPRRDEECGTWRRTKALVDWAGAALTHQRSGWVMVLRATIDGEEYR